MTDPISDFLTHLRNASKAGLAVCVSPHSKLKESLANILKNEGYVRDVATGTDERGHKTVLVTMKYVDSAPVITGIKRSSTPGRRLYSGYSEIPRVLNGLGHRDHFHLQGSHEGPGRPPPPPAATNSAANSSAPSGKEPTTMSRIGKQPVPIPDKVKIDINGTTVSSRAPRVRSAKLSRPS